MNTQRYITVYVYYKKQDWIWISRDATKLLSQKATPPLPISPQPLILESVNSFTFYHSNEKNPSFHFPNCQ